MTFGKRGNLYFLKKIKHKQQVHKKSASWHLKYYNFQLYRWKQNVTKWHFKVWVLAVVILC